MRRPMRRLGSWRITKGQGPWRSTETKARDTSTTRPPLVHSQDMNDEHEVVAQEMCPMETSPTSADHSQEVNGPEAPASQSGLSHEETSRSLVRWIRTPRWPMNSRRPDLRYAGLPTWMTLKDGVSRTWASATWRWSTIGKRPLKTPPTSVMPVTVVPG
jgi:hypothetical protein